MMTVQEFRRQIGKGKFFGMDSLPNDVRFEATMLELDGHVKIGSRGCNPMSGPNGEAIVYGVFDDLGKWTADRK